MAQRGSWKMSRRAAQGSARSSASGLSTLQEEEQAVSSAAAESAQHDEGAAAGRSVQDLTQVSHVEPDQAESIGWRAMARMSQR